jgi:hypothetical protein
VSPWVHFQRHGSEWAEALRIAGIKRLKTLDLLSTTRPWVWTLPATSTAGPIDRDLPGQGADQLLELHLHP